MKKLFNIFCPKAETELTDREVDELAKILLETTRSTLKEYHQQARKRFWDGSDPLEIHHD